MDVVYHLASVISILPVVPPHMHRVNVDGTANVIRLCEQHKVRSLVYTSSLEVASPDPFVDLPRQLQGHGRLSIGGLRRQG